MPGLPTCDDCGRASWKLVRSRQRTALVECGGCGAQRWTGSVGFIRRLREVPAPLEARGGKRRKRQ